MAYIFEIGSMTAFDLSQSLTVKVVVKKLDFPLTADKSAPFFPTWQGRNKIIGRSEFDVELKIFFELRELS